MAGDSFDVQVGRPADSVLVTESVGWPLHYGDNGETFANVAEAQAAIDDGILGAATDIWYDGLEGWETLADRAEELGLDCPPSVDESSQVEMNVECPEGMQPGDALLIATEWGQEVQITVPVRCFCWCCAQLFWFCTFVYSFVSLAQDGVTAGDEFAVLLDTPPGWSS